MTVNIDLHMGVQCCHETGDEDEPIKQVVMHLSCADPEVPYYVMKCPECNREVLVTFDPLEEE